MEIQPSSSRSKYWQNIQEHGLFARMIYRGYEITYDPLRGVDCNFAHLDPFFDGPEDHRYGCAASIDDAKAHIDEITDEQT